MTVFNAGEFGQIIRVNLGTDVSSGTEYQVTLEPRAGYQKDMTSNVALGTVNVTVDDQEYLANQYLEYTIQENDFKVSTGYPDNFITYSSAKPFIGMWRARGQALVSGVLTQSDFKEFTVLP